ncbi:hypothetical protein E4U55_001874, partial [Claviceps digitariae]
MYRSSARQPAHQCEAADDTPQQSPPSSDIDDTCEKQKQRAPNNQDAEPSPRTHTRPLPRPRIRTRFSIDPRGSLTHDKTTVDVVAVPCPGGHPLRSWNRDGLMGRYYGALSMRDAETKDGSHRPPPSWIRQGIRREADRARVLLYEHPSLDGTATLDRLAEALLEDLQRLRDEEAQERPVLFIGHSVGGLVVKMALTKAARHGRYENILRECYGVAFF